MSGPIINDNQGNSGNLQDGRATEEPLSVLLVEDNPGDARLFEEYLKEGPVGASLRHEETLDACIEALGEEAPDVLVADLGLPDSQGDETIAALVAAAPEVPIVVLTGRDGLEAALQAQEAGATEYLQKEELTAALVGRTLRWATQRHRMQAKLRQRDAWIRSITEGLSAGVFRAGPTGRIEYANEALAEMLGFENEEELVGRDLTEFYANPIDKGKMLAEEGASDVEIEFEGQDGTGFVGLLSAKTAYDSDGTPIHYDGTVTDITERVRQEKQFRMLSEAVEQAKESVLITEAEPLSEPGPRVEYVNSAYEEMTGYSKGEMTGKTPRVLQGPETDQEVLDSLRDSLEAGEEWEGETLNYRKDGEPYLVHWNVAPVRGERGEIEHWVSVQRDVTDEREREERLRLLARALEQVGDKVIIADRDGEVQYVNEAFEQITGYSEEEALGETPQLVQSGEQNEMFYEELWDSIRSGETFRADLVNQRKDGTQYIEDEQISPVTDEEGTVTHFVSTGRDVTEKRKREEELIEAKEEAERMNQLKSAFLANMSHEIRTPLTSILGFAEAIGEEVGGAGEASEVDLPTLAKFSSLIERSGQRLMDTLTGVLNLSKLQAGEMDLSLEPVDLTVEAEEAADEFGPQAENAGLDLTAEVGGEPIWARADEGGLQIALRNLLSNAIKYTEEGGEIRVQVRQEENMAALAVEDTGIGMDPDTTAGLFEAFKQASEGIGREYEGTGLGLTVTKEVLGQMGGSIEVETEKGEGSRFTIRLPRSKKSGEE